MEIAETHNRATFAVINNAEGVTVLAQDNHGALLGTLAAGHGDTATAVWEITCGPRWTRQSPRSRWRPAYPPTRDVELRPEPSGLRRLLRERVDGGPMHLGAVEPDPRGR